MSALSYAAFNVLRALPRKEVSRFAGSLAELQWQPQLGKAVIELYRRAYRVSLDECEQTEGFESFDAFFTRRLRQGTRPIEGNAAAIVAPCDGRVDSIGRVDGASRFLVKGNEYTAVDLLGSESDAASIAGGAFSIIYLSPRDYHRVHTPVDGTLEVVRSLPGDFYPVNEIGTKYIPKLFAVNRRVSMKFSSPFGNVFVVMVAAMVVGRITVSGIDAADVPLGDHLQNLPMKRGAELGVFHLGSTVVLFFEENGFEKWDMKPGAHIRFGERIATGRPSASSARATKSGDR